MLRVNQNNYKILTPDGFSPFDGIQKIEKDFYQHIIFDDETEIKVSVRHPFGKDKRLSKDIKIGDFIDDKQVLYNELVNEKISLYDPINVQLSNLYISNGVISHNCEFLGSVNTLISPSKIQMLAYFNPMVVSGSVEQYKEPIAGRTYVCTVDVARGVDKDYSAFVIFDVTQMPYEVVALYKNNEVRPFIFPNIISEMAKRYNNAHILTEVNDIGQQIAEALNFEIEYPNIMMTTQKGRAGQLLGAMYSGRGSSMGVRMTKQIKRIGCANIKTLIEGDKLIVNSFKVIEEMSTFTKRGQSWQAEDGCNDDLMMCLVIFGWLSNQAYFKELTNTNARQQMYVEQQNLIEQDMAPFGFLDDGINAHEEATTDEYGDVWHPVVRKGE